MDQPPTDPLERSAALRREADMVLEYLRLTEIAEPYGRVVPTGSYYLDLMMYPDIDLYLSPVSVADLFAIGGRLAESEQVFQVVFERSQMARLPGGLYLKPRIAYGAWERPWKVDIWSLAEDLINAHIAELDRLKAALTADLREQIVRYKYSILTAGGRTPMLSGYHIYRAFIDEGLTDFVAVTRYLVEQGIQMA
jgi:hypothetical protein